MYKSSLSPMTSFGGKARWMSTAKTTLQQSNNQEFQKSVMVWLPRHRGPSR